LSVRDLEIRHRIERLPVLFDTPLVDLFPSLRRVTLCFVDLDGWLPLVDAHEGVTALKVVMDNRAEGEGQLKDWAVEKLWKRVEDFSIVFRAPGRGEVEALAGGQYRQLEGSEVYPLSICVVPFHTLTFLLREAPVHFTPSHTLHLNPSFNSLRRSTSVDA
jgi:hypothetical protein